MNEQLKQFATQAWNYANKNSQEGDGLFGNLQLSKFAELIVKECMTMCDETQADYFKHRKAADDFTDKNIYAEGEAASDIIKYKMKKHFGVKE